MNKTGNKIVVNLFVGGEFQDVPVMRNGKLTKRTKRQYVSIYEDRELIGIEVQGHEIFIDENENTIVREIQVIGLIMIREKELQLSVIMEEQAKLLMKKLLITI